MMPDSKLLKNIVKKIGDVAQRYGYNDCYVVGGYPRAIIMGNVAKDVNDLDFASAWPGDATKLGGIVAGELRMDMPEIYHRTGTVVVNIKGIDCEFQGVSGDLSDTQPIMEEMHKKGVAVSPLTVNIYARDFTINTLILDVTNQHIFDVTGFAKTDIQNGLIRTPINPYVATKHNPMIVTRSIRFAIRYNFRIEKTLRKAMKENAAFVMSKYKPQRMAQEALKLLKTDYESATELIDEYGLDELLSNNFYNMETIVSHIGDIHSYKGDLTEFFGG